MRNAENTFYCIELSFPILCVTPAPCQRWAAEVVSAVDVLIKQRQHRVFLPHHTSSEPEPETSEKINLTS